MKDFFGSMLEWRELSDFKWRDWEVRGLSDISGVAGTPCIMESVIFAM